MVSMRPLAILGLVAGLAVTPAIAQSTGEQAPSAPELRLPEKLDEALRDMMDRMKPTLEDLLGTFEIFEQIDSLEYYQRPEVLPNGDIIIRRRNDAPLWVPPDPKGGIKT